jgi:parallel beta-helix repeat protein
MRVPSRARMGGLSMRPIVRLLLVLILSLSVPPVSWAATRYVSPGGSGSTCSQGSPCSLNTGLPQTGAGDTLYLLGGTYAQCIDNFQQSIASGTSWSNPVIIASAPGETATLAPNGGDCVINLNGDYHYLVFDRLRLDLGPGGGSCDIVVSSTTRWALSLLGGAHHIRFQNGEILSSQSTGCGISIALFGDLRQGGGYPAFHEILNNTIHGSRISHGIYVATGQNTIERNTIYDNGGYGIQIYSGDGGSTSGNIVRNNMIRNNGFLRGWGALTVQHGDSTFYNNVIYDNYDGVALEGGSHVFDNNTIFNNHISGLGVGSNGSQIRNNIILNNGTNVIDHGSGAAGSHNLCNRVGGLCTLATNNPG